MHPFLGRIPSDARWQLRAEEIVGILTPLVEELADPDARRELPFTSAGFEGHVLWGLSLRMLEPLVPRLLADDARCAGASARSSARSRTTRWTRERYAERVPAFTAAC